MEMNNSDVAVLLLVARPGAPSSVLTLNSEVIAFTQFVVWVCCARLGAASQMHRRQSAGFKMIGGRWTALSSELA